MKFKIVKNLTSDKVLKILPNQYKGLVNLDDTSDFSYTVMLFPLAENSVTYSTTVDKALRRLDASDRKVLAIGYGFTVESMEMLHERHIEVISRSNSMWTDKRREISKVLGGARVKLPAIREVMQQQRKN